MQLAGLPVSSGTMTTSARVCAGWWIGLTCMQLNASRRLFLVEALAQLEALGGNLRAANARLQAALPTIREYADTTTLALALGLSASLTWRTRHDFATARIRSRGA